MTVVWIDNGIIATVSEMCISEKKRTNQIGLFNC